MRTSEGSLLCFLKQMRKDRKQYHNKSSANIHNRYWAIRLNGSFTTFRGIQMSITQIELTVLLL